MFHLAVSTGCRSKDRILHVWEQRRAEANDRTTEQDRRVGAIQQKLDKPDEAFLYSEVIDVTTYGRQRDKLREELTLAKIDHHAEAVDELDVEGILAFAERILPRASDCGCRRRSTTSSGCRGCSSRKVSRTTEIDSIEPPQRHHLSNYLAPSESADEKMVSRVGIEPERRGRRPKSERLRITRRNHVERGETW